MRSMTIILLVFMPLLMSAQTADEKVDAFYGRVVNIAKEVVGLQTVPPVNGKRFLNDCIGFVNYVYYRAGFDLVKAYGNGRGGVSSLYDGLLKHHFVFDAKTAAPGDLIFFDNTYDINRNGKWDDPLSHIGIIVGKGKHNTLYYIHFASHGVEVDQLNLYYPNTHAFKQKDGKLTVINSYLRRDRGEGYAKKEYVTSSFYRAFAHIRFKVKEK